MGGIFSKEDKELDLSPSTLHSTSVEDKVWLSVTEENLFTNESFTNEKYFMLQNVTVREGPQEVLSQTRNQRSVPSNPALANEASSWSQNPSDLSISTDANLNATSYSTISPVLTRPQTLNQASTNDSPSSDPSLQIRPKLSENYSNDIALSLMIAKVVTDERELVGLTLTRLVDSLPVLSNSTTAYFDSTLQKRLYILKRIHLALHRERAREKLMEMTGNASFGQYIGSHTPANQALPYSSKQYQSNYPTVVRVAVRLLITVIQRLQRTENSGVIDDSLKTLMEILNELPPLALRQEPSDCLTSLRNWIKSTIDDEMKRYSGTAGSDEKPFPESIRMSMESLLGLAIAEGSLIDILAALSLIINCGKDGKLNNYKLELEVSSFLDKIRDWKIDLILSPLTKQSLMGTWSTKLQDIPVIVQNNTGDNNSSNVTMAVDGTFIFIKNHNGLHKVGTGFGDSNQGRVYISRNNFFPSEMGWLCCIQQQLYFKPANSASAIFVLDTKSLETIGTISMDSNGNPSSSFTNTSLGAHFSEFCPSSSSSSSSQPKFPLDTQIHSFDNIGRSLPRIKSPIFTEGRFLYTLLNIGQFDSKICRYAVDTYDPLQHMKHIKRVVLHFKENDSSAFISPVLSPSVLNSSAFYTNGHYLMVIQPQESSPNLGYVCRCFNLANGELLNNYPTDIADSFNIHSLSILKEMSSSTHDLSEDHRLRNYGFDRAANEPSSSFLSTFCAAYDFSNNIIWCTYSNMMQKTSEIHVGRFANAGLAPKLNFKDFVQNPDNILTTQSPRMPAMQIVTDVLKMIARLSEESMPSSAENNSQTRNSFLTSYGQRLQHSCASLSNVNIQQTFGNLGFDKSKIFEFEPFCVELGTETFRFLYALMKQSQEFLHESLSSKQLNNTMSETLIDAIDCHFGLINSCLSILKVNMHRLISKRIHPIEVGLGSSFSADSDDRGNPVPTKCLITNIRRLLRYLVDLEDAMEIPLILTSKNGSSNWKDQFDCIRKKACQVLTVGLDVFYPSYYDQSFLFLKLLNSSGDVNEAGVQLFLDSLINSLSTHKNPSYWILPPETETTHPISPNGKTRSLYPKTTPETSPRRSLDSGLFVPILSKLLRESQASACQKRSLAMLTLIQSIQKDLLLRAEDDEGVVNTSQPNLQNSLYPSQPTQALVVYVQLILNITLETFESFMSPDHQITWLQHEKMNNFSNSIVGTLLPTLLHSLFLFSSNLWIASQLLPPIIQVLRVLDPIHSIVPPESLSSFQEASSSSFGNFPQTTASGTSTGTKVVESHHPYQPGQSFKQVVTIPGSLFLSLIFDERCSTVSEFDSLQLFEDEQCKKRIVSPQGPHAFSGNRSNWPKRRVIVPGDKVVFLFKSTSSQHGRDKNQFASSFQEASKTTADKQPSDFGYRCVVIGNMMSNVQSSQSWSIHLEKTLCCLGGQLASSLIRGGAITDNELDFQTSWLDHPLFDGGLKVPNQSPIDSTNSQADLDAFLLSMINMKHLGAEFVNWASQFVIPPHPNLQSRLAPVKRAERSLLAAILYHSGLTQSALHFSMHLQSTETSLDKFPEILINCFKLCSVQMKRIRDSIMQLKQKYQEDFEKQTNTTRTESIESPHTYKVISDEVVSKCMFLLRDVLPSLSMGVLESQSDGNNSSESAKSILQSICSSILSFVLTPESIQTKMHDVLVTRADRARHRTFGLQAMQGLLLDVQQEDMRHEVLHFLGSSIRLSAFRSGSIDENSVAAWPHSVFNHLRGCGAELASKVTDAFRNLWFILAGILKDPFSSPFLKLLALEPWALKFSAVDFDFLDKVQIIPILHNLIQSTSHRLATSEPNNAQSKRSAHQNQILHQLISSSKSMFKLIAITCIASGALDIEPLATPTSTSNSSQSTRSPQPQRKDTSNTSSRASGYSLFHDSFFEIMFEQLTNAVDSLREETRSELAGYPGLHFNKSQPLFSSSAVPSSPHQNFPKHAELIDLLSFLYTLSSSDVVKRYLAVPRFVRLFQQLLMTRSERSLKALVLKIYGRILPTIGVDPHMLIDYGGVEQPLIVSLFDIVGKVHLWSSSISTASHSSNLLQFPHSIHSSSFNGDYFVKNVVSSSLLFNRPFIRTFKKRVLTRSSSGKLALSLPFCPFFDPSLALPMHWDSARSTQSAFLTFSPDLRTSYFHGANVQSNTQTDSRDGPENRQANSGTPSSSKESQPTSLEDLDSLSKFACVVRADRSIPEEVPLFYFEVRFEQPSETRDESLNSSRTQNGQPTPRPVNGNTLSSETQDATPSGPGLQSTTLSVGLFPSNSKIWGLPGWFNGSYGYHSTDGNKYRSSKEGRGERYARRFTFNDVIGCGWNRLTGTIFFTKNGAYLGTAFKNVVLGTYVPVVGMIGPQRSTATANFGQMPFMFDLSSIVRRSAHQVKQVNAKMGKEATTIALEMTSLLRSLLITPNSPWKPAIRDFIKENIDKLPLLVSTAASNVAYTHDKTSNFSPTLPPKVSVPITIQEENDTNMEPHSSSSEIEEHQQTSLASSPRSPRSPVDLAPSIDDRRNSLPSIRNQSDQLQLIDSGTVSNIFAALAILGGDIEDLRHGGSVQVSEGLNTNTGIVLEYKVHQPLQVSIILDNNKKTMLVNDPKYPKWLPSSNFSHLSSMYLSVKPTTHSAIDIKPVPEAVISDEFMLLILPDILPILSNVFLEDRKPNSPSSILRQSIIYSKLKSASLKVMYNACLSGKSLCSIDQTLILRLLEQTSQITKEHQVHILSGGPIGSQQPPVGASGSTQTNTSASQTTSKLDSSKETKLDSKSEVVGSPIVPSSPLFPSYQSQQGFNSTMPLSSLPQRLDKIERLCLLLSHKVFEANAASELSRTCSELFMDEDEMRAPRRSVDYTNGMESSSTLTPAGSSGSFSVVPNQFDYGIESSGALSWDDEEDQSVDSESGYTTDIAPSAATSSSMSSGSHDQQKRNTQLSTRRSSQIVPTPSQRQSRSNSTSQSPKDQKNALPQSDAPFELAEYGKPTRFCDIKLGNHMTLCQQDKGRRPSSDWVDSMNHLVGMSGIVCDLDSKLSQVLLRFIDKKTGLSEDWWIPHRLLVTTCNGLAHDEFELIVSPYHAPPLTYSDGSNGQTQTQFDSQTLQYSGQYPAGGHLPSSIHPSTSSLAIPNSSAQSSSVTSSLTSTLLAPFSFLSSSKDMPNSPVSKPKESKDSKSVENKENKDREGNKSDKESKEPSSKDKSGATEPQQKETSTSTPNTANLSTLYVSPLLASSRDMWSILPENRDDQTRAKFNIQGSQAAREESIFSLALYWEHQRNNILIQMLFSTLFINDPQLPPSSLSIQSLGGPLQLVHVLRLISATMGDREVVNKLLGSHSPFLNFGSTFSGISSLGTVPLLSCPPRPIEHRLFESRLIQLIQQEASFGIAADVNSNATVPSVPVAQESSAPVQPETTQTDTNNAVSSSSGTQVPIQTSNTHDQTTSPSSLKISASLLSINSKDSATTTTEPAKEVLASNTPVTSTASSIFLPSASISNPLPFVLPEEPVRGYLIKLGKVFRQRKKLWFVLNASTLTYYKNSQPNQVPLGYIDLRNIISIETLEKKKKEHEFDVIAVNRTLSLQASSSEEKDRWISSISQHTQYCKLNNLPMTSDSLLTAFINEGLLHLKESLQPRLLLDPLVLIATANKANQVISKNSHSREGKDRNTDREYVHPLSTHSFSKYEHGISGTIQSEKLPNTTSFDKLSTHAQSYQVSSQHAPSLLIPPSIVGTAHPSVQSGNVIVLEQWLYPYPKKRMKKMIKLDWAENLLVVFDLSCHTRSGQNVLRFYRNASCTDLIASFSGTGPSAFPPLIIPRADRFWMVFSSESLTDSDLLSPSGSPGSNHRAEFGVKFQVSAYLSHPPASLLNRPSFEFGILLVEWLLSLVDPHWLKQSVKEVFQFLTQHLETNQALDRRLRVLSQLKKLLQRWFEYSDTAPPMMKLDNFVSQTFELFSTHKRLQHQDYSILFQKSFELACEIVKIGDYIAHTATIMKEATKDNKPAEVTQKEQKEHKKDEKDRESKEYSKDKDLKESKDHHKETKASEVGYTSTVPLAANTTHQKGYFREQSDGFELNFWVEPPSTAAPPSTSTPQSTNSNSHRHNSPPLGLSISTMSQETSPLASPSSPSTLTSRFPTTHLPSSVATQLNYQSDENQTVFSDNEDSLTNRDSITKDTENSSTESSTVPVVRAGSLVALDTDASNAVSTQVSPLTDSSDVIPRIVTQDGQSTSDTESLVGIQQSNKDSHLSSKRTKKHRRIESLESEKKTKDKEITSSTTASSSSQKVADKEKEKHDREKEKESQRAEKEREKAERERERTEKEKERLEKEKERLEKEREKEALKRKKKQQAKEAQQQKEAILLQQRQQKKQQGTLPVPGSSASSSTAPSQANQSNATNDGSNLSIPVGSQTNSLYQSAIPLSPFHSQYLSQFNIPQATITTSSLNGQSLNLSNKSWFDQALFTIKALERLQHRRMASTNGLQTSLHQYPSLSSKLFFPHHLFPQNGSPYTYNEYSDFSVEFAQESFIHAKQQSIMQESPHPYPHGVRVTSKVAFPKATQLLVYFDPRSCTEANCDYLMFSKDVIGGDDLAFFTGTSFPPSHNPLVIQGDSFIWSFLSDANGMASTKFYWGFRFNVTPVFNDEIRVELHSRCEEEFRRYCSYDLGWNPMMDNQLMRFVNSTVENLKVSSSELSFDQCFGGFVRSNAQKQHQQNPNSNSSGDSNYPLLATVHPISLQRRFNYIQYLNYCVSKLVPLIDFSLHTEPWSIAWLIHQSKHLLFYDVKLELLNASLISSQTNLKKPVVTLNRQIAAKAEETNSDVPNQSPNNSNDPNKTENPKTQNPHQNDFLFIQGFRHLHFVDPARLRHPDKAWEVKFEGEGADDAGGPYRDSITQFCLDLHRPSLGLFIPTENQKGKVGLNQDKFVPNPLATSPKQLAKFEFLGKLMGIAIRTKQPLELSFPSLVWKSLVGSRLDRSDLESIDKQLVVFLDAIENFGDSQHDEMEQNHDSSFIQTHLPLSGFNMNDLNSIKNFSEHEKIDQTSFWAMAALMNNPNANHASFLSSTSFSLSHLAGFTPRRETRRRSLAAAFTLRNEENHFEKLQFDQIFFETFRTARTTPVGSPASFIDLIPNGSSIPVVFENRKEFAALVQQFRLTEFSAQISAIATGLATIVPTPILSLFSWSELELRVCGRPGFDIELLKKKTVYHQGLSATDKLVTDFWKVLASFTPEEHVLFLRFVWGRSRLPSAHEFGSQLFHLQLLKKTVPHEQRAQPMSQSRADTIRSREIQPEYTRTSSSLSTQRLLRLYESLEGQVADDDLQDLLLTSLQNEYEQSNMINLSSNQSNIASEVEEETEEDLEPSNNDMHLPQSQTCFFQLSIPRYRNYETLRSKLLYAITSCREIDTDFVPASQIRPTVHNSAANPSSSSSSSSSLTPAVSSSQVPMTMISDDEIEDMEHPSCETQ